MSWGPKKVFSKTIQKNHGIWVKAIIFHSPELRQAIWGWFPESIHHDFQGSGERRFRHEVQMAALRVNPNRFGGVLGKDRPDMGREPQNPRFGIFSHYLGNYLFFGRSIAGATFSDSWLMFVWWCIYKKMTRAVPLGLGCFKSATRRLCMFIPGHISIMRMCHRCVGCT